LESKAEGTHK